MFLLILEPENEEEKSEQEKIETITEKESTNAVKYLLFFKQILSSCNIVYI